MAIEGTDAEIKFFTAQSPSGTPFLSFQTRNLERENFPDVPYNISPDLLLSIAARENPQFLTKFLRGEALAKISISPEQIAEYYDEVVNPGKADKTKLPYILDHAGKAAHATLPARRGASR